MESRYQCKARLLEVKDEIKKTFVVVIVLVLLLVGACNSDSTLASRNIRPDDDSAGESSSDSTLEKGTEGSATFSYIYKIEIPPHRVNVLQIDIPLSIEPQTDDENKYIVSGFGITTAYTQQKSSGAVCFIQCDLPVEFRVDGTVIQTPLDQMGNCFISLNLLQKFESAEPYGDCPEQVMNNYKCILHQTDYLDPRTYTFSGDDDSLITVNDDKGLTITAELSNVKIPPAIKDTCRWDE